MKFTSFEKKIRVLHQCQMELLVLKMIPMYVFIQRIAPGCWKSI